MGWDNLLQFSFSKLSMDVLVRGSSQQSRLNVLMCFSVKLETEPRVSISLSLAAVNLVL